MKKYSIICLLIFCSIAQPQPTTAQIPGLSLITGAIKKVIRAIDLKIQREQNRVIWLQNAQKTLENAMTQTKLTAISDWTEKQRKLYADYYDELWRVKQAISIYRKVKWIIQQQVKLAQEYGNAWSLLRQDKNFTPQELAEMYRIYTGILDESLKNLDQLMLVSNSFATQMSDGKRMELIGEAGSNLEQNLTDLRKFNERNFRLSISRAKSVQETQLLRKLYGLNQ